MPVLAEGEIESRSKEESPRFDVACVRPPVSRSHIPAWSTNYKRSGAHTR